MPEKELQELIDSYMPLIVGPSVEDPKRGVGLLAREIERTTRANLARIAFQAANQISNNQA